MKLASPLAGAMLAVGLAAGLATVALSGTADRGPEATTPAAPAAAARTSFPGLAAADGEPVLESIEHAHPSAGQVSQAPGPFDDRFVLENPAFDGSAVSGTVRIESDVSDVLELQVIAGFYDADGILLGTDRFVHHLGEESHTTGAPEEREEFTILVPAALAPRAVSVMIGVPVLVNE